MTRSLVFLVLSSLSLIFPSTLALSPSSPSSPSPIPLQGTSLFCTPTTQCASCPPSEMNTELCKLWGNRRRLICFKSGSTGRNSRLNQEEEKSIKDPDEQTSHTSTTNEKEKKEESTFYSFEPIETSVREEIEEEDGLDSSVDKISKEEKQVEEELREAVNAERLRRRRALNEEEEEEEEVLIWEACPRIVRKEQSDYFEFLLCNLLFGLSGLGVLLYRQRTLAGRQFGKLAARIMQTEIR